MKYLKLFSILVLSAMTLTVVAASTAEATITITATGTSYADHVDLFQDDAVNADFSDPDNAPDEKSSLNDYCVNMWAVGPTLNYSCVVIPDLENLVIKFVANNHNTNYTMSFSYVSGEELKLKQDGKEELIPMTENYTFTCELNDEITFTVVKQAAPQKDYTRENLTVDNWYTICVPGGVDATEYAPVMDVYTVAGYNAEFGFGVDPMTGAMQPGVPYIFQAKATQIAFNYNEEVAASNPQPGTNYLTGTFVETTTPAVAYVVANNMLNWVASATVPANRAYLNYADITDGNFPVATNNAPGRKFLPAPKGAVTGLDGAAINGMKNGKYIMNGRFMIVKDSKIINVLGL